MCNIQIMSLKDEVKSLIIGAGWDYVELARELSAVSGRKYTNRLLSNRIRNEIISLKEIYQICEIIGYDVNFTKRK